MIVEWLLDLVLGFCEWFLGLFDDFDMPTEALSPMSGLTQLAGAVNGMGVWVPWAAIAVSVSLVIGFWVVMMTVKIVRQVAAHVPLFGGAG